MNNFAGLKRRNVFKAVVAHRTPGIARCAIPYYQDA